MTDKERDEILALWYVISGAIAVQGCDAICEAQKILDAWILEQLNDR